MFWSFLSTKFCVSLTSTCTDIQNILKQSCLREETCEPEPRRRRRHGRLRLNCFSRADLHQPSLRRASDFCLCAEKFFWNIFLRKTFFLKPAFIRSFPGSEITYYIYFCSIKCKTLGNTHAVIVTNRQMQVCEYKTIILLRYSRVKAMQLICSRSLQ